MHGAQVLPSGTAQLQAVAPATAPLSFSLGAVEVGPAMNVNSVAQANATTVNGPLVGKAKDEKGSAAARSAWAKKALSVTVDYNRLVGLYTALLSALDVAFLKVIVVVIHGVVVDCVLARHHVAFPSPLWPPMAPAYPGPAPFLCCCLTWSPDPLLPHFSGVFLPAQHRNAADPWAGFQQRHPDPRLHCLLCHVCGDPGGHRCRGASLCGHPNLRGVLLPAVRCDFEHGPHGCEGGGGDRKGGIYQTVSGQKVPQDACTRG